MFICLLCYYNVKDIGDDHVGKFANLWKRLFVCLFVCLMVFNATFNNIFQLYRSDQVLLVKETGVPRGNHLPAVSH